MSNELTNLSSDLKRLRDEGFNLEVRAGYLLVKDVPYVTSQKEVKRGTLIAKLNLAGNRTTRPDNHVVMFCGEHPCTSKGKTITSIVHQTALKRIDDEYTAQHSFSNKPQNGYADYYELMTRYVEIISNEAAAIEAGVTARTFPVIQQDQEDAVFLYLDTATSRAGITALAACLRLDRVAIIGLGGTGSYLLDMVAKTPVGELHLFDGDLFLQHNAFRSPGAASLDELREELTKVEYLARQYGRMRRGLVPHPYRLDAHNVGELESMDFVFICIDRNAPKKAIISFLQAKAIPFIDVGMGISLEEGRLAGLVRTTARTTDDDARPEDRISFIDANEDDAYDENIQIADLNALNAALAVIKWKKLMGFYADAGSEHHSLYVLEVNKLMNEDQA